MKVIFSSKPPNGPKPTDSDVALVNYEGKLTNGTTFDKSERPTPMPVVASDEKSGRQGVVPGFSEALKLMTERARFMVRPVAVLPGAATSPAEVAELVAFLASPAGEYYSGCAFSLGTVA